MITLSTNNRQTMIAGYAIYSKVSIQVSSDERLKESIKAVNLYKCEEFIKGLDVKTFNYKGDNTPCVGVIAQDLQGTEFEDYFVFTQPGEEGYLAVKAADLVFSLIATVQKMSAEIDYLKTKIQNFFKGSFLIEAPLLYPENSKWIAFKGAHKVFTMGFFILSPPHTS